MQRVRTRNDTYYHITTHNNTPLNALPQTAWHHTTLKYIAVLSCTHILTPVCLSVCLSVQCAEGLKGVLVLHFMRSFLLLHHAFSFIFAISFSSSFLSFLFSFLLFEFLPIFLNEFLFALFFGLIKGCDSLVFK